MLFFPFIKPLYKIGFLYLPSYYLLLTMAFITGTWYVIKKFEKKKLNPVNALDLSALMVVCGLVGARLLHAIVEYPDYYFNNFFEHPFRILMIWQGGFAYYGGFILCLPAAYIFMHFRGMNFLATADIFSPAIAMGIGIARIGCLMAGCCYGEVYDSIFSLKYYIYNHVAPQVLALHPELHGVGLFPSQLLMSINGFVIFFVLQYFQKKELARGAVFALFLMFYSFARFILEFFRADLRGEFLALSTSQILGIPVFIVGLSLFIFVNKKR